ncbi:MAG: nucleoside deaminase [Salinivirgaceae bacterium]|nr:nucleoside deaminase [Salinivirgaceae bacterium]MDD4745996.1 nucleoside deaminase [Salinivirgaceae bacterium]MDY0281547.1 nucleoside deaminase [Salinivirgaceae bacterium]
MLDDNYFMRQAIKEALNAYDQNEVPIGAVVMANNMILGRGHNQTQALRDVTAHAEMIAISAATEALGSKYLENCTLYVTLEPCVMCAGALFWSKISRVVFGAFDPKFGSSKYGELYHPKTKIIGGVMADDCRDLIVDFFKTKRKS